MFYLLAYFTDFIKSLVELGGSYLLVRVDGRY